MKRVHNKKLLLTITLSVVIGVFVIVSAIFISMNLSKVRDDTIKTYAKELNTVEIDYTDYEKRYNSIRKLKDIDSFYDRLESFSAKLSGYIKDDFYDKNNFLVSPLSIYLAFAMQYECLNNTDKEKIREFLNMSESDISNTKDLLDSLLYKGEKTTFDIFNSVWLNSGSNINYNDNLLNTLSKKYYTNAIEADFLNENEKANQVLRQYIKEKTRGLIDNNFEIGEDISYLLVNTLYIQDVWGDKDFIQKSETFTTEDDKEILKMFNISQYYDGRVQKEESYSFQRVISSNKYNLTFIVPNDGYTIGDVFSEDVIKHVNGYKYLIVDEGLMEKYHTRCIFPTFDASSNFDISSTIKDHYDVDFLFTSFKNSLTNNNTFIDRIIHQTKLEVNKSGFRGAAATIIEDKATSVAPTYTDIYYDLLVNKPFGIVLSTNEGVIVFTGIINNI